MARRKAQTRAGSTTLSNAVLVMVIEGLLLAGRHHDFTIVLRSRPR